MLLIGLTGGLASGKSTVARLFAEQGIPILDADQIARAVVVKDSDALTAITRYFGDSILTATGELNRAALAKQVFQQPADLIWLETLLHPLIIAEIQQRASALQAPYAIVEIPLLAEKRLQHLVHRVLVIDTPLDLQKQRAEKERGMSSQQVSDIVNLQASSEQRLAIADDVIENNADLLALAENVRQLHQMYLGLAQK